MKLITLLLTLLLGATVGFAQGSPAAQSPGIAGNYEGTLKGQPVALEIRNNNGKLEGRLKNGEKAY